jgi:hypothetical protein
LDDLLLFGLVDIIVLLNKPMARIVDQLLEDGDGLVLERMERIAVAVFFGLG